MAELRQICDLVVVSIDEYLRPAGKEDEGYSWYMRGLFDGFAGSILVRPDRVIFGVSGAPDEDGRIETSHDLLQQMKQLLVAPQPPPAFDLAAACAARSPLAQALYGASAASGKCRL